MSGMTPTDTIDSAEAVRAHYGSPAQIAVAVTKSRLDDHHKNFIRHAPFVCIASTDATGQPNVSPKGDAPGFVHVVDDETLVIPDRIGNNKVETIENLVANPKIAMVFFVPGVRELLRVHGTATVSRDPALLDLGKVRGKAPRSALVVKVTKAYMHCGKALIRSRLWEPEGRVAPGAIPPFSQVVKDQANTPMSVEDVQHHIDVSYRDRLY